MALVTNTTIPTVEDGNWRLIDSVSYNIETYYLWVILLLGFPGNCFTIFTIIKMSPARSLTVYIALLAVVDNLAIINKILIFVLMDYKVTIGSFGCKFLGFFGNFLVTLANWVLVALSAERFAVVWFPLKVGPDWTLRKTVVSACCLVVVIFVLFVHLFWTTDYIRVDYPGNSFCGIHKDYMRFIIDVWYWVNVVVYAVLPCTLLLVFNSLIVAGIYKASRLHLQLNQSSGRRGDNMMTDRHHHVTVMLMTAAITLVILTTPRCVFLILSPHITAAENSLKGATLYLLDTLAFVFCDSTHALNFYLYSLSARRFRRQFRHIVCRKWSRRHPTRCVSFSSRHSARFHSPRIHYCRGNNPSHLRCEYY